MNDMVKELTHLTGSVALESEYFRVSAAKMISLQSSPGYEAPSVPEAGALLMIWESRAAPILEKIKQALEKEISTLQDSLHLPLLKYRLTTWTIFEEDVPDFVRTGHWGRKGEPFGYAMRFDRQDVLVVVVVSTLPKKNSRIRLREALESALEGFPAIPGLHKKKVDTKANGFRDLLNLLGGRSDKYESGVQPFTHLSRQDHDSGEKRLREEFRGLRSARRRRLF